MVRRSRKKTAGRRKPQRNYVRAKLALSNTRIAQHIRARLPQIQLGERGSIYVTGLLESIISQLIQEASDELSKTKRKHIGPREYSKVVQNSESAVYGLFPTKLHGFHALNKN